MGKYLNAALSNPTNSARVLSPTPPAPPVPTAPVAPPPTVSPALKKTLDTIGTAGENWNFVKNEAEKLPVVGEAVKAAGFVGGKVGDLVNRVVSPFSSGLQKGMAPFASKTFTQEPGTWTNPLESFTKFDLPGAASQFVETAKTGKPYSFFDTYQESTGKPTPSTLPGFAALTGATIAADPLNVVNPAEGIGIASRAISKTNTGKKIVGAVSKLESAAKEIPILTKSVTAPKWAPIIGGKTLESIAEQFVPYWKMPGSSKQIFKEQKMFESSLVDRVGQKVDEVLGGIKDKETLTRIFDAMEDPAKVTDDIAPIVQRIKGVQSQYAQELGDAFNTQTNTIENYIHHVYDSSGTGTGSKVQIQRPGTMKARSITDPELAKARGLVRDARVALGQYMYENDLAISRKNFVENLIKTGEGEGWAMPAKYEKLTEQDFADAKTNIAAGDPTITRNGKKITISQNPESGDFEIPVAEQFGKNVAIPSDYQEYYPKAGLEGGKIRTFGTESISPGQLKQMVNDLGVTEISDSTIDAITKTIPSISKGKQYVLPGEIVRELGGMTETPGLAATAGKQMLQLWKAQATAGLVLPNLAYTERNIMGNIWNSWMSFQNPLSIFRLPGRMFAVGLEQMRASSGIPAKIYDVMESLGIVPRGAAEVRAMRETIRDLGIASTGFSAEELTKVSSLGENKLLKVARTAINWPSSPNRAIESNARMALFMEHYSKLARKGVGVDMVAAKKAAEITKKYLFDYSELTRFESRVLRNWIPFYSWTRKNLPVQLESFYRNPARYGLMEKLRQADEKLTQPDKSVEELAPDYAKEQFLFPIPSVNGDPMKTSSYSVAKDKFGRPMYSNPNLPFQEFEKGGIQEALTSTNPIMSSAFQIAANRKINTGVPIYPEGYNVFDKEARPYLEDFLAKKFVRVYNFYRSLNDPDKDQFWTKMNQLVPLGATPIDAEAGARAQAGELYGKQKNLQEHMKNIQMRRGPFIGISDEEATRLVEEAIKSFQRGLDEVSR